MLTVVRLRWESVDDAQWTVFRALLNTGRLAPHGCLSWHSRRAAGGLQVTSLWDGQYRAALFTAGRLEEAVQAAGLHQPTVTSERLAGVSHLAASPRSAALGGAGAVDRTPERRHAA